MLKPRDHQNHIRGRHIAHYNVRVQCMDNSYNETHTTETAQHGPKRICPKNLPILANGVRSTFIDRNFAPRHKGKRGRNTVQGKTRRIGSLPSDGEMAKQVSHLKAPHPSKQIKITFKDVNSEKDLKPQIGDLLINTDGSKFQGKVGFAMSC